LLEESGAIEGKDERFRWVVDPLDGTNNFLHGVPFFAVTMALEKKNVRGEYEVEAAVTHEVVSRETYWAERGKGAWFETGHHAARQRLQVSSRKELSHALLCVGSLKRDAGVVEKIAGHVSGVRCLGSTALSMAYVAAGRFDVFVQSESYRWDVAAGLLLIKEAKGMVTDFREGAVVQERSDVVASNGLLHTKILACCR
jgi:myo-inositol-1(or 4)-monophosphatase